MIPTKWNPKFKKGDIIIYKSKIDNDYYFITGKSNVKCPHYILKQFGSLKYPEPAEEIEENFIKVGEITDKSILE